MNMGITLATRRDNVDFINESELNRLPGKPSVFRGKVKGDFPDSMMPTPMELELKVGAQVIFIKNDIDHQWVNGTLTHPDGSVTGQHAGKDNEIVIDSIRRGEVPGIHTITYDSEADRITITHDAHSRKGFALGAVLAAEYTANHQGLLTIADMFDF